MIIGLMYYVLIMWAQKNQLIDAMLIESVKENCIITSLIVDEVKVLKLNLLASSTFSNDETDIEIMKTKIIGVITLKTILIILGVFIIILCILLSGLYFLFSQLNKRINENRDQTYETNQYIEKVKRNVDVCWAKIDKMSKEIKVEIVDEVNSIISELKDENTTYDSEPVVEQCHSEGTDYSDILGYGECLNYQKIRLFNSPTTETIYIIRKEKDNNTIYFMVDNNNAQKAIKNKTVCLDPLCNVKGNIQTASYINTIKPGIVQLEEGNLYKVVEKAEIEFIS